MTRNPSPEAARGARVKRVLLFGLLALLLATAQCSFFAELHICPATPDLILSLTVAVLLLDSVYSAAVVAIGAGFLVDALGATSLFLSPLFYFAVVLILCVPASKMLTSFPSYLLLMLPALILRAAYTVACFWLMAGPMPAMSHVGGVLAREAIVTAILCLPIYPTVKLFRLPLLAKSRFRF